jgi:23S rRNA (cytidine1920-2'-O)/16S rRNA (cytidine1409-2'-O)-methyltransferase
MEKTNARDLTPDKLPTFGGAKLVVIDCSFISLRKIIPAAVALLARSGKILALIKPQFEAGKREADRGAGVIRDPAIHERVLRELKVFVETFGPAGKDPVSGGHGNAPPLLRWMGVTESPILGPAGNKEFLTLVEKSG